MCATLLYRDSNAGTSCEICKTFNSIFLRRALPVAASIERKNNDQKNFGKTCFAEKPSDHSKFQDTKRFKRILKTYELPIYGKPYTAVVIFVAANTSFQLILVSTADSRTRFCSGLLIQKHQLNLFLRLDWPI